MKSYPGRGIAHAVGLALALMAWAAVGLTAQSQTEVPRGNGEPYRMQPEAVEAIGKLKSPYCPTMLEVCPHPGGAALRDSIAQLAEAGWEADAMVEWVIGRHGEEFRAVPPRTAGGFIAWWMPALGALMAVVVTFLTLRAMRGSAEPLPEPVDQLSPEEEERLRAAMRELDAQEEATLF